MGDRWKGSTGGCLSAHGGRQPQDSRDGLTQVRGSGCSNRLLLIRLYRCKSISPTCLPTPPRFTRS